MNLLQEIEKTVAIVIKLVVTLVLSLLIILVVLILAYSEPEPKKLCIVESNKQSYTITCDGHSKTCSHVADKVVCEFKVDE